MYRFIVTGIIALASCSDEIPPVHPANGVADSRHFGELASTTSPPGFVLGKISGVDLRPFDYENVLWYLMRSDWKIIPVKRGELNTIDQGNLPTDESMWYVARNVDHLSIPMQLTASAQLPSMREAAQLVDLVPLTVDLGFIERKPASAVATIVYGKAHGFRGVPVSRQQVELPLFSLMVPNSTDFHLSIYLDAGLAIQIHLWPNLPHTMRIVVPQIIYGVGDVRWEDTGDPCVGASILAYCEPPCGGPDADDIVGIGVTDRDGGFSIPVPAPDAFIRVVHEDATFTLLTLELRAFSTIPAYASAVVRNVPGERTSIIVRRKSPTPR
jgi:hypothetical protein